MPPLPSKPPPRTWCYQLAVRLSLSASHQAQPPPKADGKHEMARRWPQQKKRYCIVGVEKRIQYFVLSVSVLIKSVVVVFEMSY